MRCLTHPPAREFLKNMARALREGIPGVTGGAAWTDPAAGAPAGHWLLPEGAHIHTFDDPARISGDYVILLLRRDSERLAEDGPWHWRLHPSAQFIIRWPEIARDPALQRERATAIQQILTDAILYGDPPAVHTAEERLSSALCHVFPRTIRDVSCPAIEDTDGAADITLDFTAIAATPAPEPEE